MAALDPCPLVVCATPSAAVPWLEHSPESVLVTEQGSFALLARLIDLVPPEELHSLVAQQLERPLVQHLVGAHQPVAVAVVAQ